MAAGGSDFVVSGASISTRSMEEVQPLLDSCIEEESHRQINYRSMQEKNTLKDICSDDSYESSGSQSNKHRTTLTGEMEPGDTDLLSAKYESLDYDICVNTLLMDEERKKGYRFLVKKNLAQWVVFFFIGVLTALIACCIDIAIEETSKVKFSLLKKYVDKCIHSSCLIIPYLLWVTCNVGPVLIASILVAYVEPVAMGSGIPQVKCYLNGVKVPKVVRIKTLLSKVVGVICSVLGGLAVGKEGPMIHSGAVVAAGISQGKSTSFSVDFKIFDYFREDHEKRDFVSGGAAAGVAAAFGAPVGGVLFSLEEGASFWNQGLVWRIFFCSMVSTFTLNIILSTYHGVPGQLAYSGLLNFGKFSDICYYTMEIPVFLVMGVLGGLLGALFNHINHKLTVFRMRHIHLPWTKVIEAVIVAALTATGGFGMIYFLNDCQSIGQGQTDYPLQVNCGDGEYSGIAAIWFQTPEASVRSFFHDPPGSKKPWSSFWFCALYFLLACWTYGLSVSSGLFIPTLLVGAAWGRLVGNIMEAAFPSSHWVNPGKYALIGAAAMLAGVVRMTISLTVILIEATGNITFGLPLMIVLMVAKWVGDIFNEGLYDIHIQLAGVPLLSWEPPPLSYNIYASDVMSRPVMTLKTVENVGRVVDVLKSDSHSGFPVVDSLSQSADNGKTYGIFRGLILRSQLITLLQHKIFNETAETWFKRKISLKIFRDVYPRFPRIEFVHISPQEKNFFIDLRPFMNPAPYTVLHSASLPCIFRLFRALGLRHLTVVNCHNEVVGMVTRKDLARYRIWKHRGRMALKKLLISEKI